jgi:acetolactate synthase-1/2/3 large subunit
VKALVQLCERLGVGVLESVPNYVNFPHGNVLYQGNQWNEPRQNAALAEADVVLVIDSDVPWIPTSSAPDRRGRHLSHRRRSAQNADAAVVHLRARPVRRRCRTALGQLNASWTGTLTRRWTERRARWAELHAIRRAQAGREGTPQWVLTGRVSDRALRRYLTPDTLVVNEGISNYQPIFDHLALTRARRMFTSGGGSLGWHGGAAIGAKLAIPARP